MNSKKDFLWAIRQDKIWAMGYSSDVKFGSVELQMGSIMDHQVRRAATPNTAANA